MVVLLPQNKITLDRLTICELPVQVKPLHKQEKKIETLFATQRIYKKTKK